MHVDKQYLAVLERLVMGGEQTSSRAGNTLSLFGTQLDFDLREGFPLLTTKKLHTKSIITELVWFIRGMTNVRWLNMRGVRIWDEWADEQGELGPVYGKQWRSWPTPGFYGEGGGPGKPIDQLANVIKSIKENPHGRRHIVSAWNPSEIEDMALPPCHVLFQFHVTDGTHLDCHLYQRSADWFLGVPFNIASYALLTSLMANECGLQPGRLVHSFGDYHLYTNHMDQALEQLARAPRSMPWLMPLPQKSIFDIEPEEITFLDYDPHPAIKAQVSV